jgi:CBS domain-containing membrane protein
MRTMSISTCCPTFDRNSDPFAQEHAGADHVFSFFRKLRLDWLLLHFPPRIVRSVYVFVNGFITIGVLALLALVSRNPFVFPSLGPTAYLLFFTPLGRTSSPRNTFSAMRLASFTVM